MPETDSREEWRTIKDYPTYQVSSRGRLRRFGTSGRHPHGAIVNGYRLKRGYIGCKLQINGVRRSTTIHALVAECFLGPKPTLKHEVNHKNGVKDDNRPANLEWVTHSENVKHSIHVLGYRGRVVNAETVRKLRDDHIPGVFGYRQLARKYGIKKCTVEAIIQRRCWKDVA